MLYSQFIIHLGKFPGDPENKKYKIDRHIKYAFKKIL